VSNGRDGAQVPTNLAWSLARAGWRILLVDLDLRRSTVGPLVGVKATTGLADVLLGQATLRDVVHDTAEPRLRVVLPGRPRSARRTC